MRLSRKNIVIYAIAIIFAMFLSFFKLPYYIHKPGSADPLDPIVQVENGYASDGEFHLMTVRSSIATPVQYVLAKLRSYHDIVPIESVRPEGLSEEEYRLAQLQMMQDSQQSSKVVAYTAAGADVDIVYEGVYVVAVSTDMPAEGKMQSGDRIVAIDNHEVNQSDKMIELVGEKEVDDDVLIRFERDGREEEVTLQVQPLGDGIDRVGIGVQLMNDQSVVVDPEVTFSSGNIGGPSAGLMFALEMYDQLIGEDITKGRMIAGTGKLDFDGNVQAIGGVDKKVVAADKAGCEIFFAPNENGSPTSNYVVAKEAAEDIGTDMIIVPVDTFEEALEYLEGLD